MAAERGFEGCDLRDTLIFCILYGSKARLQKVLKTPTFTHESI